MNPPNAFGPSSERYITPPAPAAMPTMGFAVIDVETTGLSPRYDRIVEIAIVHTDIWGRPQQEWHTRVNPEGPVGATHIHGIRQVDISAAPTFSQLIPTIVSRLSGRALAAHNAQFDTSFLAYEFGRAGWAWPTLPMMCTMSESMYFLPDLHRRRLVDCCWACHVGLQGAHSALGDARATAAVLARYFDPSWGRQPLPPHKQLVVKAQQVRWPTRPGEPTPDAPVVVTPPAARPRSPIPAYSRTQHSTPVQGLLETVNIASVLPGSRARGLAYAEVLVDALADGVITDLEAAALADVAEACGIEGESRLALHDALLRTLCQQAVADGTITKTEREELQSLAVLLEVPPSSISAVLSDEQLVRVQKLSEGLQPLPEGWHHGAPLRVGDRIVFTGECGGLREHLERDARAAGFKVTSSVSRKTDLLVTSGDIVSTKTKQAAEFGIRVVTPDYYGVLFTYRQPALAAPPEIDRSKAPRRAIQAPKPPATTPKPLGSQPAPAEVRKWALARGFEVGVRGRIPQQVVDAYLADETHR